MVHSEETRRKISLALKGKFAGDRNPQYGKPVTEEAKRKISETKKAQHRHVVHTEAARKKMSEANKGERHHQYGKPLSESTRIKISLSKRGKHLPKHSEESKRKMSESHKGKKHTLETRMKMSEAQRGEKAKLWKGGISYGAYCKEHRPARVRVREWFGNKCVLCGEPPLKEQLTVHHVDYNKNACCDDKKPLFVILCRSCHALTNNNREYWEKYFVDMIDSYYGGKCYFTREEYMRFCGNT